MRGNYFAQEQAKQLEIERKAKYCLAKTFLAEHYAYSELQLRNVAWMLVDRDLDPTCENVESIFVPHWSDLVKG